MFNKSFFNYRCLITPCLFTLFVIALILLKSLNVQAVEPQLTTTSTPLSTTTSTIASTTSTISIPPAPLVATATSSSAPTTTPPSSEPTCVGDECSIVQQIKSNDGKIKQVPYLFKYKPAQNNAPTIVFIPGGPGEILSNYKLEEFMSIKGVPQNFGVILIDPRFTGMNASEAVINFTTSITSLGVAEDINAILTSLNIDNYIIYGMSYGTVPATIMASLATNNPPRAIVLDGTVGRAFKQAEYHKEFSKQWTAFVQSIDRSTWMKFKEKVKNFIKQNLFTADDFGEIILAFFINKDPNEDALALVNYIAHATNQDAYTLINYYTDLIRNRTDKSSKLFHALILCREISPDTHPDSSDFAFNGESDELLHGSRSNCVQYVKPKQIALFDSKLYQVTAPIIYLQGDSDPATPTTQSLYHFKNQKVAKEKYYVYRPKGRHGLLNREFKNCSIHFWNMLDVNVESSVRELVACGATLNPPFTSPN